MKINREKLEELVEEFVKSKMIKEGEVQVATATGTDTALTPDQKKRITLARKDGDTVKVVKKTDPVTEKKAAEKEKAEPVSKDAPTDMDAEGDVQGDTIDGLKTELQDIGSRLDSMDDFKIGDKEDLKAKKVINKIKLKLDDIILMMDDLGAIKEGLAEKKQMFEDKENDVYLKQVHKLVSKRFRDKKDVEGIMKKYSATAKKHKDKDPDKVAEALFRHMLKEGWDKSNKKSVNEETTSGDYIKYKEVPGNKILFVAETPDEIEAFDYLQEALTSEGANFKRPDKKGIVLNKKDQATSSVLSHAQNTSTLGGLSLSGGLDDIIAQIAETFLGEIDNDNDPEVQKNKVANKAKDKESARRASIVQSTKDNPGKYKFKESK